MSGSPILQNGRIVGAVTHVLVNDPTRGYGIFIENMLNAAGYTKKQEHMLLLYSLKYITRKIFPKKQSGDYMVYLDIGVHAVLLLYHR